MFNEFIWTPKSGIRNELTKVYEPIQPFILHAFATEVGSAALLDIGANIGAYSVFLGAHENISSVHVFEPMDDCIVEINQNIIQNGLVGKTTIHAVALSNKSGSARFRRIASLSGANGISSTFLFSQEKYKDEIEVSTAKLDDLLSDISETLVIKLDVEGHEYNVLLGAQRTLSNNKGILQIEIHTESPNGQEVVALLESSGWKCLFRAGWDHYFSNLTELQSRTVQVAVVERALSMLIAESKSSREPSRRRIFGGIVIEIPREKIDKLKRAMTLLKLW